MILLRPFIGRIGDTRGRRILIIGGGVVVAASMAGYVVAESLGVLVGLRILTGLGEAAFYVGAASVINDIAPDDRRGEALSYFSLALFGGLAIGPVLGETVLHASDFAAVWYVAGVSSLIAGLLGILRSGHAARGRGDAAVQGLESSARCCRARSSRRTCGRSRRSRRSCRSTR